MIRARAVAGIVVAASAAQAWTGVAGAEASPAEVASTFVAVDFDRIPRGVVPAIPAASDAPSSPAPDPEPPAQGVSLRKVVVPPRRHPKKIGRKLVSGLAAKSVKLDVVQIGPEKPEIEALYVPDASASESAGESAGPLPCQKDQATTSPLRWETLAPNPGDDAKVDVKDLWFHGATCSVTAGSSAQMTFAAVAWNGTKPWLYAMRDDRSVTFLMPRATDVTVDAAVGLPMTVRGGFTRVSLPLGRWGAESFVAHLTSLDVSALPRPAPSPHPARGQAARPTPAPAAAATDDDPVEVEVELVQTMTETSPTVLVRRSHAVPDTEEMPHRVPDAL